MSIGLTRRSLLRVGALAPLIIPGRSLARTHGGAPGPVTGPCGSPIQIFTTNASEIVGPGCYQLMNDITSCVQLSTMTGITLLGNGHSINSPGGFTFGSFSGANINYVQDVVVRADTININGNQSATNTGPGIHLKNVTMNGATSGTVASLVQMGGSNILLEQCALNTYASSSSTGYDDCVVLSPYVGIGNVPASYVTFDGCTFGPNFDVAIEGYSSQGAAISPHWNHVTIKNCVTTYSPFSVASADFGGYYGGTTSGALTFTFGNCTFTGNTLATGGWYFNNAGNLHRSDTDADANATWGASGNVFGGAGALANTYLRLTREQCQARAALWAKWRGNPPRGFPGMTWNEKIVCP